MNVEQEKLIAIARSWLGTKWMHNQCKKGLGVDCVNFIWAVAQECELKGSDLPLRYSRISRYNEIEKYLDGCFEKIDTFRSTNILLFKMNGFNTHLAYGTDIGMIHASVAWGKVVEHPIDGIWKRCLVNQWKVF